MNEMKESIQTCHTLEQLRALCAQDEGLRTDLPNTKLVFGSGSEHAELMLIGEAPGKEEDEQGLPFVGRSGKLLLGLIESELGISRDEVYIANILKHRPPDNRDPKPSERNYALPYLLQQIQIVKPKLILCVGRISAQTLLGKKWALKNMRQKLFDLQETKLTVSYHPAALLRNPNWKPAFIQDLAFIRSHLNI